LRGTRWCKIRIHADRYHHGDASTERSRQESNL